MSDRETHFLDALDDLTPEQRAELDAWLNLRKVERGDRRLDPDAEALRDRLAGPLERGELERVPARPLAVRRRPRLRLTPRGQRRLDEARAELERLQGEIGGSIEAGWGALEARGLAPGVFLLERMVLLHGRFDDEPVDFFTRCRRLAAHVRQFSATGDDSGDVALLALLIGWGLTR